MSNVYLVGFMGTGKTTVGQAVAHKMKRCFVDLDELIELKEKRTIPDIFAREGEAYFRRLEHRILKEVAREHDFVVACGGGIVINKDNIALMKETGKIVCLSATPEVIIERTQGCSHRPLLNVANPHEQIALLLKFRAPFYAQADVHIDTSRLKVEKVVDKVLAVTTPKRKTRKSPSTKTKGRKSKKKG
jgi:shikimate kinase